MSGTEDFRLSLEVALVEAANAWYESKGFELGYPKDAVTVGFANGWASRQPEVDRLWGLVRELADAAWNGHSVEMSSGNFNAALFALFTAEGKVAIRRALRDAAGEVVGNDE